LFFCRGVKNYNVLGGENIFNVSRTTPTTLGDRTRLGKEGCRCYH
jgi:hypothetical protein